MTDQNNLDTPFYPTWCPGCGNFGIWGAFKNASKKEGWGVNNTVIVAGIGCHGHITNFIRIPSFEGLHGRAIPIATGIKLSNHNLNVFVFTGDGDCFGEGGNHFIHACRRNHDINIIIHNNSVYALTTGQTSPLSPNKYISKSTPYGNIDKPIYPLTLAIAAGATFVARSYAGNIPHLEKILIKANNHKGISVVEVLQPCVSFNKVCTHSYYMQNTYELEENFERNDKKKALKLSLQWGEKNIPIGIFYETEEPSYESQIPQIQQNTLVENNSVQRNLEIIFKKYI